jgi:hypothetical protein
MAFYVGDDFAGAEMLYARLGKHKKSVACLYVNKLDDVDLDVLREVIARQYAGDSHKEGGPRTDAPLGASESRDHDLGCNADPAG